MMKAFTLVANRKDEVGSKQSPFMCSTILKKMVKLSALCMSLTATYIHGTIAGQTSFIYSQMLEQESQIHN